MAEDRSLDDFAAADDDGDEESAEAGPDDPETGSADAADPSDAADATDAADTTDSVDERGVDPAVATSTWHADGAECDRCGERVERRWREGDAFVCAGCASW